MTERTKTLYSRVSPEAHKAVKMLATRHERSISYLIEDLIGRYLLSLAKDWERGS